MRAKHTEEKKKKPESTFYTSQTTIHILSEKTQSEQIAYGKTEAESGNMTVVTLQASGRAEKRSQTFLVLVS